MDFHWREEKLAGFEKRILKIFALPAPTMIKEKIPWQDPQFRCARRNIRPLFYSKPTRPKKKNCGKFTPCDYFQLFAYAIVAREGSLWSDRRSLIWMFILAISFQPRVLLKLLIPRRWDTQRERSELWYQNDLMKWVLLASFNQYWSICQLALLFHWQAKIKTPLIYQRLHLSYW